MDALNSTGPVYFTPSELCERWKIDPRTLDKFSLPWVWLSLRIRRVSEADVLKYEQDNGLKRSDVGS